MNKSFLVFPIFLLISGVTACSSLDQSITDCDNLREEIVEMTEEDRQSRGYALAKIGNYETVSKSDKRIVCSGSAVWTDGDRTGIKYESYIDEDGDRMIEYEVN